MMISPESYYEECLKGKTKEQIMTAIRGLKQEIGRLKNTMESPDYGLEFIVLPSEDTRLHWTREYLERAKQAYASSLVIFHVGHLVTLGAYESFFDYISYSSAASGLLYIFSWGGLIYNLFRDPVNKQKIYSQRTVNEDDIDG